MPRTIKFSLPGLLGGLLMRAEGLPSRERVLLPSINELGALTPFGLFEQPVADPFALRSGRRQPRHKSSHLQREFRLTLSSKIISDPVPAAHDVKAGLQ